MAQWVECLLHKHQDPNLDLQHMGAYCLSQQCLRCRDRGIFVSSKLDCTHSVFRPVKQHRETLSQIIRQRVTEEDIEINFRLPHEHTYNTAKGRKANYKESSHSTNTIT